MPHSTATRPRPTRTPPRPAAGDVLVARRRLPGPGDLVLARDAAGAPVLLPGALLVGAARVGLVATVHRDR